MQFKSITNWDN